MKTRMKVDPLAVVTAAVLLFSFGAAGAAPSTSPTVAGSDWYCFNPRVTAKIHQLGESGDVGAEITLLLRHIANGDCVNDPISGGREKILTVGSKSVSVCRVDVEGVPLYYPRHGNASSEECQPTRQASK